MTLGDDTLPIRYILGISRLADIQKQSSLSWAALHVSLLHLSFLCMSLLLQVRSFCVIDNLIPYFKSIPGASQEHGCVVVW